MKLSIVATPIGNLEDITLRAIRTLTEADVIYCEDTRVTAKLLSHYKIKKPLERLDAVTEGKKVVEAVKRLQAGERVALVTDAGTPAISDPGARLVAFVRETLRDAKIETIPGPSALTAALSIAGINSTEFTFCGFLPHKKGRQTALKKLATRDTPTVLYESPHRILKLLKELQSLEISKVTLLRELTKVYEEVKTGTPVSLLTHFTKHKDTLRGEFVIIVEP